MINGVSARPLRTIPDPRGSIRHMLRRDWPEFNEIGEVYFSYVESGAIKAWRKHTRMVMQLAVPVGAVTVVLYDARPTSSTYKKITEYHVGTEDRAEYILLTVPPGIWNGFKGISQASSLVVNCASILHDPNEAESASMDSPEIPYSWT